MTGPVGHRPREWCEGAPRGQGTTSHQLGTPGAITNQRGWDDYDLNRAVTTDHLKALDLVYQGVISDHRKAMADLEGTDPVSEDMVVGQTDQLELFHWFVRAHLEDSDGNVAT